MAMPVLPGLNESAGTPGPITDILDALTPEQVTELVYVAMDWSDAGEPPIEMDAADDAVDPAATPGADDATDLETPPAESEETLDDEANETPEEQQEEQDEGTENMEGLLGQVQGEAAKVDGYLQQFDDLADEASSAEEQGGDPEAVNTLKEEAQEYADEIADLIKEAESAAKDDDANGVAQAGLHIREKCQLIETLLTQAAVHAQTNQPAPKGEGSLPDAAPALSLWAQRYSRG